MAIGAKKGEVIQACRLSLGQCVKRLDVVAFDEAPSTVAVGLLKVETTGLTLQSAIPLPHLRLLSAYQAMVPLPSRVKGS